MYSLLHRCFTMDALLGRYFIEMPHILDYKYKIFASPLFDCRSKISIDIFRDPLKMVFF